MNGKTIKLLRTDCAAYPMHAFEREAYLRAGASEVVAMDGYDAAEIAAIDPDVICVVSGALPKSAIEGLTKCGFIMRMGTGYDKVDVRAASEKGAYVAYVKSYCSYEVAEHALALLMASARRLKALSRSMDEGDYVTVKRSLTLHRVNGKTLGIVGFGRIGRELGRMAHGIGMKVLAYDAHPGASADFPFRWAELDELLAEADFVSVNCPLLPETRGLIGERELRLMKKSAVLINVARGAICDEAAVANALRTGEIAYAAMDVHEQINIFEPPKGKPYTGLYDGVPNLLLTPHCGSISEEAWADCVAASAERVRAYIAGEPIEDCVNREQADERRRRA